MVKYESVIGLEIHCQLKTKSKMFCRCDNFSVKATPNTNVCPVCMGMPGTLPVPNKKAIEMTYLLALAVSAKINDEFNFERKNYFYPDLPKAYQITSGSNPPVTGGFLEIEAGGKLTQVRINHIHLEEDAGKLVHPKYGNSSMVDLNRAGTPLLEIVTEPDLRSPEEAKVFMQDLRSLLRHLGISDANMEQGNLRCDANVSLRKPKDKKLGVKVEIKNMNSFKMVERALIFEIKRQAEKLNNKETILQETRGWNEAKGKTISQRSKEEANDYRYFPEPDLPPIAIGAKTNIDLQTIRNLLPELPKDKKKRFIDEYNLSVDYAAAIATDLDMSIYFEQCLEQIPEAATSDTVKKDKAKKIANWLTGDFLAKMNNNSVQISETKIKPADLARLVENIDGDKISGKMAKEIFIDMFETGKAPDKIIKEKGWTQITDQKELEEIIEKVIKDNPGPVLDYQKGKKQALGYLIGQIMSKTQGQANPQRVNEILAGKINNNDKGE